MGKNHSFSINNGDPEMKKMDKTCEISMALPLTETNLFAHLLQVCFRHLPVSKFE